MAKFGEMREDALASLYTAANWRKTGQQSQLTMRERAAAGDGRCSPRRAVASHASTELNEANGVTLGSASAVWGLLVDQKGHSGAHRGMGELPRAHRILVRLTVTELPMHVCLLEESCVGHDTDPHAALAQTLDLDSLRWLTRIIEDAGEPDGIERVVVVLS
jgi:hypothetical protein